MTKQEKQRQWIKAQGYPSDDESVTLVYEDGSISLMFQPRDGVLGVVKDKQFIPMPQFEDDKPEPRDFMFQAYLTWYKNQYGEACTGDGYAVSALQELNNRLKALESKVLDDE